MACRVGLGGVEGAGGGVAAEVTHLLGPLCARCGSWTSVVTLTPLSSATVRYSRVSLL